LKNFYDIKLIFYLARLNSILWIKKIIFLGIKFDNKKNMQPFFEKKHLKYFLHFVLVFLFWYLYILVQNFIFFTYQFLNLREILSCKTIEDGEKIHLQDFIDKKSKFQCQSVSLDEGVPLRCFWSLILLKR